MLPFPVLLRFVRGGGKGSGRVFFGFEIQNACGVPAWTAAAGAVAGCLKGLKFLSVFGGPCCFFVSSVYVRARRACVRAGECVRARVHVDMSVWVCVCV